MIEHRFSMHILAKISTDLYRMFWRKCGRTLTFTEPSRLFARNIRYYPASIHPYLVTFACEDTLNNERHLDTANDSQVFAISSVSDGYYSNESALYLIYDNPIRLTWTTALVSSSDQLETLKNALAIGRVLDRILILPRFHCVDESRKTFYDCPLNSLIAIAKFDSEFGSMYRESSFFSHHKVPNEIRWNVTSVRLNITKSNDSNGHNKTQSSQRGAVKSTELLRLFNNDRSRILSFDILYNVRVQLDTEDNQKTFDRAIKRAFKRSDYRQLSMLRSWESEVAVV